MDKTHLINTAHSSNVLGLLGLLSENISGAVRGSPSRDDSNKGRDLMRDSKAPQKPWKVSVSLMEEGTLIKTLGGY